MTRARLIVNPAAGLDRGVGLLPLINDRLRTVVDELDVTVTSTSQDVERAAGRAVAERCDAIYVAGGDGTLNGVLRGMALDGRWPSLPIGVLPAGTGNDFARALGLGESIEQALDVLVAARTVAVDVGTVNGVPFVNASAGGFVADVSESVTDGLKDVAGKVAYLIGGARALLASEPFTATATAGGERPDALAALPEPMALRMFAVCNARFIGGGFPIAPDALIDDGLLDVLVVPDMRMLDFVAVLQQIGAGEHHDHPDVHHFRAPALDLRFDRPVRLNTDGEVLEAAACTYRVLRRAVRFFCGSPVFSQTAPRNHV